MPKKMVIMAVSMLLMFSYSFAVAKNASEVVAEVDKILTLIDIKSEQKMIVHRKDGTIRPYKLKVLTSGSDKSFAEITDPPREKGRQMLLVGDTVWSYLPSVKKSIRVSGRGSFMGGDFENNDILRLDLANDYTAKIVEGLPDKYVIELKGKNVSLSYAKIKLLVRKKDSQPLKQEYYTISDKLIKSTVYSDIKDFGGGFKRPAKLVMQSALYPKQKSILEIISFKQGIKNPAKFFRKSNLGK